MYGFSSNMRSKLVSLRRIILVYSYDRYIVVVRRMKQSKDAVWSLVLLLVTGVRADPKHSYS